MNSYKSIVLFFLFPFFLCSQQFGDSKSQVKSKLSVNYGYPKGWVEDDSTLYGVSDFGVLIFGFKNNYLISKGYTNKQSSLDSGFEEMKRLEDKFRNLGLSIRYSKSTLIASYSKKHYITVKLSKKVDGSVMLAHIEFYEQ
jgi:hypothetical protein